MTDIYEQFVAVQNDGLALDQVGPAFKYAKVKPTNNCNSKCITCSYWEHDYKDELTFDEISKALAELRDVGVEEVMFTGGEPTMRKDLADMVAEAKRLGFSNIGITTNSLSLKPHNIDVLLEAGLSEAVLSLEGLETHDEIRGVKGNVGKVVRNLEYFTQARDEKGYDNLSLKIATTLMNQTLDQIPGVVELVEKFDATLVLNLIDNGTYFFQGTDQNLFDMKDKDALCEMIDWLIEQKKAKPGLIGNSVSSLNYARRYFDDPKQADVPCYLGYIGCEVDANGDVFSNCWGLKALGNIRDKSLKDILVGEAYAQRCQDMYNKKCAGCSCGYVLNLSYHPDAVSEDKAAMPGFSRDDLGYAGERKA